MNQEGYKLRLHSTATYRICIQGCLDDHWSDYLAGLRIDCRAHPTGHQVTTLTGRLIDQAALLGVLNGLYTFGLPLLSVECLSVEEDSEERTTT